MNMDIRPFTCFWLVVLLALLTTTGIEAQPNILGEKQMPNPVAIKEKPFIQGWQMLPTKKPLTSAAYPLMPATYSLSEINKNLKRDKRLIISGSVLAGTGVAAFGVGLLFAFPGGGSARIDTIHYPNGNTTVERVYYHSMGTFIPFAMFILGAGLEAAGITTLSLGLGQRHKWRKRKEDLNLHAGILPDGQLGFAMRF